MGPLEDLSPTILLIWYLSDEGEGSVLPELFYVMGEEILVKFLKVFSGRKIEVPSVKIIREAFRAVQIWNEMKILVKKMSKAKAVKALSERFDILESEVTRLAERVQRVVDKVTELSGASRTT